MGNNLLSQFWCNTNVDPSGKQCSFLSFWGAPNQRHALSPFGKCLIRKFDRQEGGGASKFSNICAKNAHFHRLDLSQVPQHYPHYNSSVTSQNRKSHCYFSNSHNPCDLNRLFGISWGGTMEPQTLLVWSYSFHEDYYLQLFQVTHKYGTFHRLFTLRESDSDFALKKGFIPIFMKTLEL